MVGLRTWPFTRTVPPVPPLGFLPVSMSIIVDLPAIKDANIRLVNEHDAQKSVPVTRFIFLLLFEASQALDGNGNDVPVSS